MVARFHFDDVVFERLLQDRLRPDEQESVTRHVERCTSCQSKLEALAEAGINLEELRGYLRKGQEHADETRAQDAASEANPVWVGFLEPSDRPDSLGRFGRYEILEVLGRGGTGIVMRGYDPSLNRQSAIKVLSPELAASAAARKRFSREAKSAAAVVHEHVVPIQTVDEEQGLPYLVMPVLEGRSLEDRVRKNGPLDVKEILRIGRQVASGLAAAHAQGLVHRDVKPANVLLHNGVERVVITDFGLARAADDASMTQSGTLVGTPQYMSPEQAKGETLDARSDLFSLGSVLYFMCTGHSPFRADTTMGVLNRITNDTPRSLTQHNPEIPQWFDQIVRRLLAKRPEDRYASAADVETLLGQWLAHLQDPVRIPRPAEPKASGGGHRTRIGKLAAAAFGGFLLLWTGIFVVLETGKGTLTIESSADDVAVRIRQGEETYEQLTVKKGENDVRLGAGKYVVEIEGEHDGLTIERGEVTLTRGDKAVVRIAEQVGGVRITEENKRLFRNIGIGRDGNEIGVPFNSDLKSQPDKAADMQWMSRNVRVEMFAPPMMVPGEAAVFQAVVTNIGDSPLEDVCVRGSIDPNLKVLPRFGETVGEENEIVWKIPRIRPQERVVLKVQGQLQNSAKAVTNRVSVTAGGRSRIAGAAIRAASSVRVMEKTDASSTKEGSDPLDNEMLAKLRGTWLQVEDFNPRPDGVIGRSGLRPMFLMFQGSKFSLARFRGKTSDYGLQGAWNVTARDQSGFNLKMDFQVKEMEPVGIVPTDEKLDLAHSFQGTLKLEGNHLTIKVETAQNAPEFLEPLPIEWKFVRLHPVDAPSNRPPTVGPEAKWVPGNAPRQQFERPQLPATFEKLRGEWIQPQKLDEKEWGGMRLTLDGDQYRLTRDHIGQGVRHEVRGTFDAAEGVEGSPNTIYFSRITLARGLEGRPATANSQQPPVVSPYGEPGAKRAVPVIESKRLFSGTYDLDGDRLTLHIDKGPNAPDFVGELPATWVLGRPPAAPAQDGP